MYNDKDDEYLIEHQSSLDMYRGTLHINLLEIIEKLSDDAKEQLMSDGGFWVFIEKEFAKAMVEEFSGTNYNSIYTELRSLILNSDSMPELIRNWARSMSSELEYKNELANRWRDAYYDIYRWAIKYREYAILNGRVAIEEIPVEKSARRMSYAECEEYMKNMQQFFVNWGELFPSPKEETGEDY